MSYIQKGSELVLIGDVGDLGLGERFFTAADVRAALVKVGRNTRATARINSGGGSATEGAAVAAAFAAHPGKVTCVVEGVAASAASVAACGADRIEMALGAVWMLHEGSALTIGTVEDHQGALDGLEAVNAAMADLYARKSGIPVEAVRDMMERETWMTPDEACDAGFAEAIVGETEPRKPARFDYAARYQHAPAALLTRLPKAKVRRPEPPLIADDEPLDPAEIAELCAAAEQPALVAELIRAKVTLPQARARLDVIGDMTAMLTLSRGVIPPTLKAEMLSGKLTITQARERIFDAMAARSEDPDAAVDHHKRSNAGAADGRVLMKRSMEKMVAQKYGPDALKKKDTQQ
ncbi:head maturation protease, ClpP-related [Lichenibacterium ramalinae]|uniref:Clp protease ClpP n=1 Tax=Lichenibacterium ramalinae TaxID=2316527 RepID=A0A4Q2REV7_9HYPH|nr:head maturation protease, ClpP-related [Lichenibacterium ramalinae]RYB05723.1 Clp protease ClpP [Lichenibacterium ramalinae]